MKKLMTLSVLLLAGLASAGAFEDSEAQGHLDNFVRGFDTIELAKNDARKEMKWFLAQDKQCGTFMRNTFNNDKDKMETRMAALFVLCKGWPDLSERFLAKAEASSKPELAEFGKRLRAHVGRPPEKEVKKKFDNTEALGYLKKLNHGFEETNLDALNARKDVQWFYTWEAEDSYDFLEAAVNNSDLKLEERMIALFILVKGYRDRSWHELKRAEENANTDLVQFAKRVRAYFDVPAEKPKK